MQSSPARLILMRTAFLLLALALLGAAGATMADDASMTKVAEAILNWDGGNPGDLFKAVRQANPDAPAIVSMRELNKAIADKSLPPAVMEKASAITQKQGAAQKAVRKRVTGVRESYMAQYLKNHPEKGRSLYGCGDIGSWATKEDPDASMDIDWTVFGVDPAVTAEVRDGYSDALLADLAGQDSGLTLKDFDVVVTAEGHECAAGVFETEGGIDWAKRNMQIVSVLSPSGKMTTYKLGTGDPIGQMAMAEQMARLRNDATNNGDYGKLFDASGNFKSEVFDDPNSEAAKTLYEKYGELLSTFGVDFYQARTDTATGGCVDMAKHLQEEALSKKFDPQSKIKKTLKYVRRADNISRGAPGMIKLMESDPILGDPAYKAVVTLAKTVGSASPTEIDRIVRDNYGDTPDAGLQELGNKARRVILRMAELNFQCEMDRIILEVGDKAGRKAALDKLTSDFKVIAAEGGEYADLARTATEQVSKVSDANETGAIDEIRKNYKSLEKIRQADKGVVDHAKDFLSETDLGKSMLEMGGKLLDVGNTPIGEPAEGRFRSSSAEFVGDMIDTARAKGLKVVDLAGSVSMWAEVIDSVRTAKSDAELAIALSKTLINNTFFGVVLNTAYAGIVQGDNAALAKAVMYMLVPETALPALVEALGNTAINIGSQMLFEAQLEAVYNATTFDSEGNISDFAGLGMAGTEGARFFIDTMCDGVPEMVAQDIIDKSKATDMGKGANAIAIKAVAKAIFSTVENGNPLLFKEDGPLAQACAGIRKCTEDINDCAKIWGIEVALAANTQGDLPSDLSIGQTRALVKLMNQREQRRKDARAAMSEAIVRTFEQRHRAEQSLDEGKAKEEYEALLRIFDQLGISKEGQASLDEEGAPYNLITNWTTSLREKQVTAVKAVQKFKDAYTSVLQARARAEDAAKSNIGDSYEPEPRPLTGSLPLTAKPETDLHVAAAYLSDVGEIGESCVKSLEALKKGKLAGDYDAGVFKKLYDLRFRIAYWSAMMTASSAAQEHHWKIEIFDKQALYNKHAEAFEKVSELRKQDSALLEEFKKHYGLDGEFIVELTGPEQILSGKEAKLVCAVKVGTKDGEPKPVAADIAKQFTYAWSSGKADLGADNNATRNYKLDTVGKHVFKVVVKRTVKEAGKTKTEILGEKEWTVKVTEAVSVAVQGAKESLPGVKTKLKAVITADKAVLSQLRCVWKEGDTRLGEGESVEYSSSQEKTHKITVIVLQKEGGKESEVARAEHEIKIAKEETKPAGSVTATVEGARSEVVKGGSIQLWASVFRKGEETLATFESDEIVPYLQMKWEAYYKKTHPGEDLSAFGSIPDRPAGWGVEKLKVIWKSDPALGFSAKETINHDKTSIVASAAKDTEVSVWGEIQQEQDGKFVPVGTTEKLRFKITENLLRVKLEATKTELRPGETADILATVTGGEGPFSYEWTGNHAGASADMSKVTFGSRKGGQHVLSCEATDSKGRKGVGSITLSVLAVTATLEGVKGKVTYGDTLPLSVKIEGLDKIVESSAAKKTDGKEKNEDWVLTAIERDDMPVKQIFLDFAITYNYGDTSFMANEPLPNAPVHISASWSMPPQRVKPGTEVKIPWSIDGHGTKLEDGGGHISLGLEDDYTNQYYVSVVKGNNQGYGTPHPIRDDKNVERMMTSGTYKLKFPEGLPGKQIRFVVHATAEGVGDGSYEFAEEKRTYVYTFAGEKPVEVKQGVKVIWQSEPGITFNPGTSADQKTNARFDRMGTVKVWAEVLAEKDGDYQSVGETDQAEVEVTSPSFIITYDPPEGQAKVGQEVKATIKKTPDPQLDPSIVGYAWSNPATSNRMQLDQNASVISFKLKDANPIELFATAKVPMCADVIAEIKGSYVASPYTVKAEVIGPLGPKPQVWKEGVGLVNVEAGAYASDQNVRVKATIEGDPLPAAVRWRWTANEGTSIVGSDISDEATFARHETGAAVCTAEARDKDDTFLGRATATFSVTVSADDLANAKKKAAKIEVALSSSKATLKYGEVAKLTASTKGGKAPYQYSWTGDGIKANGSSATFTADEIGPQTLTVNVTDSSGSKGTKSVTVKVQGDFAVNLTVDKKQIAIGETAVAKAAPKGGKAPYVIKWYGKGVLGQRDQAKLTAAEPGPLEVTVQVTDAKNRIVKDSITVQVAGVTPTVTGVPAAAALGSEASIDVSYADGAKPALSVTWHSEPALQITPANAAPAKVTFSRKGQARIWVEVASSKGKVVGKSEPVTVNVAAPEVSVEVTPAKGAVGAESTATASFKPDVKLDAVDIQWSGAQGSAKDPRTFAFTPTEAKPIDLVCVAKDKATGEVICQAKQTYEVSASKPKDKDKPAEPKDKPTTEEANKQADQKLAEAEESASSGGIGSAEKIINEVAKTHPEKAAATAKKVAGYANQMADEVVVDLNFPLAIKAVEAAVRLEPGNSAHKDRVEKLKAMEQNWNQAQKLSADLLSQVDAKKLVTAEKTLREMFELISPLPPDSNAPAWYKAQARKLSEPKKEYQAWLTGISSQAKSQMDSGKYDEALATIKSSSARELFPKDEEELKKLQSQCEQKKATAAAKPADTTPTPAKDKKPVEDKKPTSVPEETKKTEPQPSKPEQPDKPTMVYDNGNSGGCSLTDTAKFQLAKPVIVTQLAIWYSWKNDEKTIDYKIYNEAGSVVHSGRFEKGGCDPYQKNWCDGLDEPNVELAAGTYTLKIANARMCQNSGSGGNGMVRVITGGILIKHQPVTKPADTKKPAKAEDVKKPAAAPEKPQPTAEKKPEQPETPEIVKPDAVEKMPAGWVKKVLGDVTCYVPSHWKALPGAPADQGGWYQGDIDTPDIGFGVVRGEELKNGLNMMQVRNKGSIKVGGLAATSYIGNANSGKLTGWLISMDDKRYSGKSLIFIGVAKPDTWDKYKPTLEKVIGSIRIGGQSGAKQAPAAKPAAKPAPKKSAAVTVTATLKNDAKENVHIFIDGDTFGPQNRLTPGQSRTLSIKLPADGRVRFHAGRNGQVLANATWNGDPDSSKRAPKVTFTSGNALLVTTVLK